MTIVDMALCAIGIAFAAWLYLAWRGISQDWLPAELKEGEIVLVEHDLFTDAPYPVVGRPDQVYRLPDGLHVPLENKNRDSHRVFDTDIAEMSLQAWLLRLNGKPTATFGYVAINNRRTGKRQSVRVDLWDDAACEQLIQRYLAVTSGSVIANKCKGPKCKSCGHQPYCYGNQ